MHYFITGGAGFIGSNYVNLLLEGNYGYFESVTVFDNLNYASNIENIRRHEKNPKYRFIKGDICDKKLLGESIKRNSNVLHFAAETHVDRSLKDPEIFVQTNILGTQNLLEVALQMDSLKFVFISTDEVYGSKISGFSREIDALNPTSPYAASKAAAEMLVNSYQKNFGLNTLITRSCNNFGPNQDAEKLMPKIINQISRNEPIPIYGDGKNLREWIFVEDNCNAINSILTQGKSGETYNIGTGELFTNLQIVNEILSIFKKSPSLIQFVPDRIAHDYRYALDSTKIQIAFGFVPKYSLKSGLASYADDFKSDLEQSQ